MAQHHQMLREVSRTFALSIEQLPGPSREALTLAYLLLRVSDGIEDHPSIGVGRKVELLELWESVLAGTERPAALPAAIGDLDPDNPEIAVALRSEDLLARVERLPAGLKESLLGRVRKTTLGMARWQRHGPRVADEAELDDYMHQVAGRVGYLITDVFAWYSPALRERRDELLELGREFGLGLQTVNVIRGLRGDLRRGWIFVPQTYLDDAGLSGEELFDPAEVARALQVVERLVVKAERHLRQGLEYVLTLPRRLHRYRLMCIWPLLFATRTLAVSRGNPRVLRDEAKITREDVRAIMRASTIFGWSNRWLEWYYERLNPLGGAPQAAQRGQTPTTST
ncbi:phytoene/squalene synthase family protein [soil metagenome]